MSKSSTVWSKTILMGLLCILSCNTPLQAFSATEQLGKLKDFVLDHPKVALGIAIVGLAVVSVSDAYVNYHNAYMAYQEALSRENVAKVDSKKLCNVQAQKPVQLSVEKTAEQVCIDEACEQYAQEKLIFQQKYEDFN